MTDVTQQDQPPGFDGEICAQLRARIEEVIAMYPAVRGISATVDYFGDLNDAAMMGVWVRRDKSRPDSVIGSLFQTLRLLDKQVGEAVTLATALRQRVEILATELRGLHEEAGSTER